MTRTLVLNVTHEPLAIVSAERALTLVLKDKVDVVSENGTIFHSENEQFRAPSVIRTRRYVHVPYSSAVPVVSRKAVFARDKGECQYCGGRAENLDHVVPQARGGTHTWDNLVAACRKCNAKKADKTLAQSGMKLRNGMPKEPKGSKYYVWGRPDPEWAPYLG